MYNTDEFQVIRSGKPILVSKLTEVEAKQELCAAMIWMEKMQDKAAEIHDLVDGWSVGLTTVEKKVQK